MDEQLENLICRWLDGTADAEDVRRLDERLRTDPQARRQLLLAADQDAAIHMMFAVQCALPGREPSLVLPSAAAGAAHVRSRPWAAAAALAALLALALGAAYWAGRVSLEPLHDGGVAGRDQSTPKAPAPPERSSPPGGRRDPVQAPPDGAAPRDPPGLMIPPEPEPDGKAVLASAESPFERWPHRVRPEPTFEEMFASRWAAARSEAIDHLLLRRRPLVRLIVVGGDGDQVVDLQAEWKDVVVDPAARKVRVKGSEYEDVSAVIPPGWFEPEPGADADEIVAHTALCAWAMATAGADPRTDVRLAAAIRSLVHTWSVRDGGVAVLRESGPPEPLMPGVSATHAAGLRAAALAAVAGRLGDPALEAQVRRQLGDYAELLLNGRAPAGGFGYELTPDTDAWNIASTHRAMLGLEGCWRSGIELSERMWHALAAAILDVQNAGGGWGRLPGAGSDAVSTAEAIGCLMTVLECRPRTGGATGPDVDWHARDPFRTRVHHAIERGLAFYERQRAFDETGEPLFTAGRIGAGLGLKRFAGRDWFRESAELLLRTRRADGSWGPPAETAWNLMFLARGSTPVVVNKLRWGPPGSRQWMNYPRDAANLAAAWSRSFGVPAGWQVVDLNAEHFDDLFDAPVLYVCGHGEFAPKSEQVALLRRYLDEGGTLLFAGAGTRPAFTESVHRLADRLYPAARHPDRRWTAVPANHPVYSLLGQAASDVSDRALKVPLQHLTDGRRSAAFLLPEDVGHLWQANKRETRPECFGLFEAITLYARDRTGPPRKLRPARTAGEAEYVGPVRGVIRLGVVAFGSRGTVRVPATPGGRPAQEVAADSDWDGAPAAWRLYGAWLRHTTGFELRETRGVSLRTESDFAEYDALVLSGRFGLALSDVERNALRRYVDAGGSVLFDSAGEEFLRSATRVVDSLWPDNLEAPKAESPVIAGLSVGGFDVPSVGLSRAGRTGPRDPAEALRTATLAGSGGGAARTAVLISSLELSTALGGGTYFDREGLDMRSARMIAANFLLAAKRARGWVERF